MIEIVAPDGSIVEFPDGTPDDVITGVMRQNYPAPAAAGASAGASAAAAPPAAPAERGALGQATALGTAATQGFGEGLAEVAGMPVDAINNLPRLRNVVPSLTDVIADALGIGGPELPPAQAVSEKPFMGSEYLKDIGRGYVEGAGALGLGSGQVYEPQNTAERYAGRVGREIGAQALPVAGLATAGARAGVQGARAMNPVGRFFVEPFAVNPGRAVGEEIAAGVATGIGAQTGRELFGQDSNTADLAGSLAGGGLYAIGRTAGPAIGDVAAALTGRPGFASDVTKGAVVDTLISNSDTLAPQMTQPGVVVDTDPLVQALTPQPRVEQVIPGYRASSAEAAGDQGLAALEAARARGSATPARFNERVAGNTAAVDARLEGMAPKETPGAFSSALQDYRGQRMQGAADDLARAQQAFDQATANLRPATTGEARGAVVRGALDDALSKARDLERAAWQNVAGETDPAPLAAAFDDVTNGLTLAERQAIGDVGAIGIPGQLVGDPEVAAAVGVQPVDLREVTTMRGRLTDAARAARSAGEDNKARLIDRYVEATDAYLDTAVPDDLRAVYDQARAVSRNVNDRFTRPGDPVASVVRRREGRPVVPDSGVAGRFVQPDEGQASNLTRLLGEADTPDVRGAIRDQIIADARDSSGGFTKPGSIEDFILGRQQVFGQMPDARDELTRAVSTRRGVERATQQQADTLAEVGPGGSGAAAKYLEYSDARAADAMKNVMAAKDPGKQADALLAAVGNDPKAIGGARRAWWDVMEQEGRSKVASAQTAAGVAPWAPTRWKAWLQKPGVREVAERLYRDEPEHLQNLDEIAEVLRATGAGRQAAVARNPSGTALSQRGSGVTLAEVQSKFYSVRTGHAGAPFVITLLAQRFARAAVRRQSEQAFQRLLDDALLEPEKARFLLTEYNPANRAALGRKLRTWYGDRAATLFNELDEDDEQRDPVMDAIVGTP